MSRKQEEKHGKLRKLFWSLVLAIVLSVLSIATNMLASIALGREFNMQTAMYSVLFSTVLLVCYILIYKNE